MLSGCRTEEQCEVVNYIPFCRPDLCQKNVECIQDPTDIETLCVSTTRMPGLSSKNWIFYRVLFIAPATQVFYGSCPSGFQKIENSMACEDENECLMDSNICGSPIYGKCENLIGSFVCKCRMPKKSRKLIFPFSRIGMTMK